MNFFAYYMGPLRSVSSLNIWGPPQVSFFAYNMGATFRSVSSLTKGATSDQFFRLLCGAPLDKFLCILHMGAPSGQFLRFNYYRGPHQISFFAYHMGAPSDQFLCILYGGTIRSVSSHTIWNPSDQFLCLLNGGPSGSGLYSGGLTRSIVLRCDDHTGIFTCDGCARDPYFYVPAETQSYM